MPGLGGLLPRGIYSGGGPAPRGVPGLGGLLPGGTWSRREAGIPACTTEADPSGETATAADDTHQIGMHSCL